MKAIMRLSGSVAVVGSEDGEALGLGLGVAMGVEDEAGEGV